MSTTNLIDRLEQILPGIQNSNSAAENAMVEALPRVIAELKRLKAERDVMAGALAPFATARLESWGQRQQGKGPFLTRLWLDADPNKACAAAKAALESSK